MNKTCVYYCEGEDDQKLIDALKVTPNKILSGKSKNNHTPSAEYCADILQLSPHYFNDLLKFESEKDIYEYYQLKRLDKAKKMLLNSDNTVSMITEKLGYPSVQYFSHWFKKLTGIVPNRYRLVQN